MSASTLQFIAPGDLTSATGGYVYDRKIIAGLRARGWRITPHALDSSFPHPNAAALQHAHEVLASLPEQALVLIDGLALGAMPQVLRAHARRLTLVALIHLPLAAEVGLASELARRLEQSERQALQMVHHVIVTSRFGEQMLLGYGIAPGLISVAEPGTDEAPLARRAHDGMVRLLCVATVSAGKGHDLLIDALAPLAPLSWRLTCVGSLTRDPTTVQKLRSQLRALGLVERVRLVGEVEAAALAPFFLDAELFVLPTRLESYCMAVAEALAYGLPIISTRTGAIAELVGSEAGLLVALADVGALHRSLARALSDPALRTELARGAEAARARLPRWPSTCERLDTILEGVRARRTELQPSLTL